MISNCGHDERGKYSGGVAGDNNGTEYQIRTWYNRPWTHVLRHPDEKVRKMISELAIEAAKNDCVGYDQGTSGNTDDRYSFWNEVKLAGYRPANITKPCETDCSNSTAVIVKCAGYLMDIDALKAVSIYCYTGNIRSALNKAGFKTLTDDKYIKSEDALLEGDILLNEGHHICVNISDGKYAVEMFESVIETGEHGIALLSDVNVRTSPDSSFLGNIVDVWKAGTVVRPTAKVFNDGGAFFKVGDYYITAKYAEGWIKEGSRWWYLQNGYTYPSKCVETIDGLDYAFDRNGWLVMRENINMPNGDIIM